MKKAYLLFFLFLLLFCGEKTNHDQHTKDVTYDPGPAIEVEEGGEIDPVANTEAKAGGVYTTWGSSFPKSLNMYLDYNSFSAEVMGYLFEPLIALHSTENKPVGMLASKWHISDDKKTFTFTIHPKAMWSDGTPITAQDVQFYYDVIMNPQNLTPIFRVDLQRFERPVIIDDHTIKISANESHWRNFWTAAGLTAFPRHRWKDVDFNTQNFEFPVVSGPYRLKEVKKGRFITLERRKDWWGRVKRYNQNKYNFAQIKYKFMEDRVKALEAFKKGVFDAYAIYTSSIWIKQTEFDAVKKGWVARQRIFNKEPKGFQGLAINLREDKFSDVRVRQALCHLLNREKMNQQLMYNQYFLLNSFYPDLYPDNINPTTPVIAFNPEKARKLLKEAGWKVGNDGLLRKNGIPFTISFLSYSADQRHLSIYIEDLKKVGIQASIEQLTLSTFRKRIDNHDFDMVWMAWGASRLRDPEASWHSKTADQNASNNITGVKDGVIDSLIELQKTELDIDVRNDILKQIDARLVEIVPYVFLWQSDNNRILYWRRFGMPEYVFDKYNREDIIGTYWFIDPEKEKNLNTAMKENASLPERNGDIYYKE